MSELPPVAGGEVITSAFTNQVADRTIQRYASAAARDASIPVPVAAQVAYLLDNQELTIYDGATWISYKPGIAHVKLVGNTSSLTDGNGDFAVPTGFTPSSAVAMGTQATDPSVFMLSVMDSVQVVWRAWDPVGGAVRANTTVGYTYLIYGP